MQVKFADEKFSDLLGPRSLKESYKHKRDYAEWWLRGWSSWVYGALVLRGAFVHHDPVLGARDGQELQIREECQDWFLFPSIQGNEAYCNTEASSTRNCSERISRVLVRMGRKARGYSTFRKGLATRALTHNLLLNRGCGLEERVELILLRVGGWDVIQGHKTLRRHYVSKVIDDSVDLFNLALGRAGDDPEERAALLKEYMGSHQAPHTPAVDSGRKQVPLLVTVACLAWPTVSAGAP